MNHLTHLDTHENHLEHLDTVSFVSMPGAGKGTLIGHLQEVLAQANVPQKTFEVGEMVRNAIDKKTEFGRQVIKYSSQGLLVPDRVIIPQIRKGIADLGNHSVWLLDGFPRNADQVEPYLEIMEEHGRRDAVAYLQLHPDKQVARELAEKRMWERGQWAKSIGKPPRKDDVDPTARRTRLDEADKIYDVIQEIASRDPNKVIVLNAALEIDEVKAHAHERLVKTLARAKTMV